MLGPRGVAGVFVALAKGALDGGWLACTRRVFQQLVLVFFKRQVSVGQQHNHLVLQAGQPGHGQQIDANQLGRAVAWRQAGMVGLSQVLQVVQGQPGEAPAPVSMARAKGQRCQTGVLLHTQQGKGSLDEGRCQINNPVFVIKTHVKRRLR